MDGASGQGATVAKSAEEQPEGPVEGAAGAEVVELAEIAPDRVSPAIREEEAPAQLDDTVLRSLTTRDESPLDPWVKRYGFDTAFDTAEARALVRFAVNQGIDPDGAVTGPLDQAILEYEASADPHFRLRKRKEMLERYASLSRLTAPLGVTGRTIVHSANVGRELRIPIWLGVGGLVVGIAVEAAVAGKFMLAANPFASYVGPLAWGALGASVYLIKTISDKASELSFDLQRLRGVNARILLGAVFGTLVVNAFGMTLGNVTTAGVAFVAGLGVKVIYAAFEALVNGIADRISGKPQPALPPGS